MGVRHVLHFQFPVFKFCGSRVSPRSSGVEHVLGKDGVTSSNLVEGSRRLSRTEGRGTRDEWAPALHGRKGAYSPLVRRPSSLGENNMAAVREIINLQCTECKRKNYSTTKNRKTMTEKLELRKFCRHERKHTAHREVK